MSDLASTLQSTRWCHRGATVPLDASATETSWTAYTFSADGTYIVEQFVERDPGGLQTRDIARHDGLTANGVWKVESEQASLSRDKQKWVPIALLPDGRIRIGEEECAPCGARLTS
jgi:hypothetical protein